MAHAPFNLSLCLQVNERRMAQEGIRQELNILYTCSLSASVSEGRNGLSMPGRRDELLAALTGFVIVWRIAEHEGLRCQPVALNPSGPNGGLQPNVYLFNATGFSFI